MSELSRIDERLSQVVELLRCLVSEVRETRRILAEVDKRMNAVEDASAAKRNPAPACSTMCQGCAVTWRRGEDWDPFHYGTRLPCDICGTTEGLRALMPNTTADRTLPAGRSA